MKSRPQHVTIDQAQALVLDMMGYMEKKCVAIPMKAMKAYESTVRSLKAVHSAKSTVRSLKSVPLRCQSTADLFHCPLQRKARKWIGSISRRTLFFSAKTNPKLLCHSSHALRGLNDTRFVETKKVYGWKLVPKK